MPRWPELEFGSLLCPAPAWLAWRPEQMEPANSNWSSLFYSSTTIPTLGTSSLVDFCRSLISLSAFAPGAYLFGCLSTRRFVFCSLPPLCCLCLGGGITEIISFKTIFLFKWQKRMAFWKKYSILEVYYIWKKFLIHKWEEGVGIFSCTYQQK